MRNAREIFGTAAAVRESRKIALDQVVQSTKISLEYLRAIERAEFEALPGGLYDISYIRQYAQALDFDEQDLLEAYRQAQAKGLSKEPQAPLPHGKRLGFGAALKRLGGLLFGAPTR